MQFARQAHRSCIFIPGPKPARAPAQRSVLHSASAFKDTREHQHDARQDRAYVLLASAHFMQCGSDNGRGGNGYGDDDGDVMIMMMVMAMVMTTAML